jgi:hypothetical protein
LERASANDDELITRDEFLRIEPAIKRLEIALRTDIGVYEVEEMEERKRLANYAEVIKHSRLKAPVSRN